MRTSCPESGRLSSHINQQNLALLHALDFDLALLTGLEIQGCQILELVLLFRHDPCRAGKGRQLGLESGNRADLTKRS